MSTHRQVSPALSALPEESIWKRYSSRMEFPLSFGLAVLLHLAVALIAGLAGVLVFSFEVQAAAPIPQVEAVIFCGGSGLGDSGSGDGWGDPNGPPACILYPMYPPEPSDGTFKQVLRTGPRVDREYADEAEEKRREGERLNDIIIRPERKHGFTIGRGWSDGFGRGEADGSNPIKPKLDGRHLRQSRWKINLPRESPEAFVKKLNDLKVLLVIPTAADGSYNARYLLCDDLAKRPATFKPSDEQVINDYNRLWFMSHHPTDAEYVATALKLTKPPRWIAIFIPPDLEQALARAEFAYKKMSEDELNQRGWVTLFDVALRDDWWVVRVRYQGPKP